MYSKYMKFLCEHCSMKMEGGSSEASSSSNTAACIATSLENITTDDVACSLNAVLTLNTTQEVPPERHSHIRRLRSLKAKSDHQSDSIEKKNKTLLRVVFEVVSTRTVSQFSRKYVAYTVLIKRVPGLDRSPAVIERRYSEFRQLFFSLRARHPEVMQDIVFPNKTVIGNFKSEIIMQRSKVFEELLLHVYAVERLRQSAEFAEFLYNQEIREAQVCLRKAKYDDALPLLENAFFLQEKLLGENHTSVLSSLCEIVAAHHAAENIVESQKFAEVALSRFGKEESHPLYVPLLLLSIRLWWSLGKDKKHLEKRLQSMRQSGVAVDGQLSLLEMTIRRHKS